MKNINKEYRQKIEKERCQALERFMNEQKLLFPIKNIKITGVYEKDSSILTDLLISFPKEDDTYMVVPLSKLLPNTRSDFIEVNEKENTVTIQLYGTYEEIIK